jgi:hypothetical protein
VVVQDYRSQAETIDFAFKLLVNRQKLEEKWQLLRVRNFDFRVVCGGDRIGGK